MSNETAGEDVLERIRADRDAVVTDWGPEGYDGLLRIQAMVEGAAARFVATRATAAGIAELTRIVDVTSHPDCTRDEAVRPGGEFNAAVHTRRPLARLASITEHIGKAAWLDHRFNLCDRYTDGLFRNRSEMWGVSTPDM
ncbi:hypothetical protein ACFQH9_22990 [Pseudonocardia lutea]|uniref:Uncharacterized protein n=1 Tax=Pseudonocardia lutea TaxID=2172015 RepID=A0ABW1IFS5_9PSEU